MKLLFICTGNTCRSPMAMCMARHLGHEARSAGLFAAHEGTPASKYARAAMQRRGLSLSEHYSRPFTQTDLQWADLVICATEAHRDILTARYPWHAERIIAFNPPIPDPYGSDDDTYEHAAKMMENQLAALRDKP
jgi:protein-tyrosine phosphatase